MTFTSDYPHVTPTGAPVPILGRISKEPLIVDATDGTETILAAKDVFSSFDFDRKWRIEETSDPTTELPTVVYEMIRDATLKQIFASLGAPKEVLRLTQGQIIGFVKKHREYLQTRGGCTLFLFKSKGKFLVATVNFYGDKGLLEFGLCEMDHCNAFDANRANRIVVPLLT